jgi:hypothetical protein
MGNDRSMPATGSILVLTLWVVFFLSALAVAVHVSVTGGLNVAWHLRNRQVSSLCARGGLEQSLSLVAGGSNRWDGLINAPDLFQSVGLGPGRFSVYYVLEAPGGVSVTNWGIVGEESKININKASQPLLLAFLRQPEIMDAAAAGDLAAAIIDWRDANDDVLTGGAEGGYYRALREPYVCRNGDFQSLHELRLVRGVDDALYARLVPHLTVYGTGKVNINGAGPLVLRAVADAAGAGGAEARESLIGKLAQFRGRGNVFRDASVSAIAGALDEGAPLSAEERMTFMGMMPFLIIRSTYFGGIAEGHSAGERASVQGNAIGGGDFVSRAEFVIHARTGAVVQWHEY